MESAREIANMDIYYKIRKAAFKSSLYILKEENDADDVAQVVCLKFMQFPKEIKNHKAWSWKVVQNEAFAIRESSRIFNEKSF